MLSSIAVPTLMFITLGVVFVLGLAVFLRFRRKPSNRHPMKHQRERNLDQIRRGDPPERR